MWLRFLVLSFHASLPAAKDEEGVLASEQSMATSAIYVTALIAYSTVSNTTSQPSADSKGLAPLRPWSDFVSHTSNQLHQRCFPMPSHKGAKSSLNNQAITIRQDQRTKRASTSILLNSKAFVDYFWSVRNASLGRIDTGLGSG